MISNHNASLTRSQLPEWPATKSVDAAQLVAVRELLGRLEALLKRPYGIRETTLNVGPLQLDLLTRTVARGQRSINLLPREFRLLEYMMRHHGQLVTRAIFSGTSGTTTLSRNPIWWTSTWAGCAVRSTSLPSRR